MASCKWQVAVEVFRQIKEKGAKMAFVEEVKSLSQQLPQVVIYSFLIN